MLTHLYHGTVDTWLPSIMQHGLRYVQANKWRTKLVYDDQPSYDPSTGDPDGYIYLAQLDRARDYARNKALYLRTPPCNRVSQDAWRIDMLKDCNAPVIQDAKPVVLSIPVSAIHRNLVELDPSSIGAIRYKGIVAPQYIKVIK